KGWSEFHFFLGPPARCRSQRNRALSRALLPWTGLCALPTLSGLLSLCASLLGTRWARPLRFVRDLEVRAHAVNRLAVQLARTGLGDFENFGDFSKAEIFLVVKTHHQPKSVGQSTERTGDLIGELVTKGHSFRQRVVGTSQIVNLGHVDSRRHRLGNF